MQLARAFHRLSCSSSALEPSHPPNSVGSLLHFCMASSIWNLSGNSIHILLQRVEARIYRNPSFRMFFNSELRLFYVNKYEWTRRDFRYWSSNAQLIRTRDPCLTWNKLCKGSTLPDWATSPCDYKKWVRMNKKKIRRWSSRRFPYGYLVTT